MHPEQQPSALHVIESHVTMERFVDHGVGIVPLDVTLSYDPADPFAVTVVLPSRPLPQCLRAMSHAWGRHGDPNRADRGYVSALL